MNTSLQRRRVWVGAVGCLLMLGPVALARVAGQALPANPRRELPPARATCLQHSDVTYGQCYNFPFHMLTGENVQRTLQREELLAALPQHGFRKVASLERLDAALEQLQFGDVIVVPGHAGVVWRQGGRGDLLIRHFVGKTTWDADGNVVSRSDEASRRRPLDRGLYVHTLEAFCKLPRNDPRSDYGSRPVDIWRLAWVGDWEVTRGAILQDEREMPVPVMPANGSVEIREFTPGEVSLEIFTAQQDAVATVRVQLNDPLDAEGLAVGVVDSRQIRLEATFHMAENGDAFYGDILQRGEGFRGYYERQ